MATTDRRGGVGEPLSQEATTTEESGIKATALSSRQLEGEAARIKSRLDNQKSIIDDLLDSENVDLLNQEIEVLDKVYDEYVAVIAQLRESSPEEEAERLSEIIHREDAGVFKKKELVSKLRTSVEIAKRLGYSEAGKQVGLAKERKSKMDREPLEPKPKPENERAEGLEKEDRIAGRDMACKQTTTTERKTNEGAEASMFR